MERFDFHSTKLDGLFLIEPKPLFDERGCFERLFSQEEFKEMGFRKHIAAINHSRTKSKGTVRGMHFQNVPFCETKVVVCIKGSVWDVAVDIRSDSPTFLKWHGEVLSSEKRSILLIPEGFAHGFQTLEDECELLYFHTQCYRSEYEGSILYSDPAVGVEWKLPVSMTSPKDAKVPLLDSQFKGLKI